MKENLCFFLPSRDVKFRVLLLVKFLNNLKMLEIKLENSFSHNLDLLVDFHIENGIYSIRNDEDFINNKSKRVVNKQYLLNSQQMFDEVVEEICLLSSNKNQVIDYLLENRDFNPERIDEIIFLLNNKEGTFFHECIE